MRKIARLIAISTVIAVQSSSASAQLTLRAALPVSPSIEKALADLVGPTILDRTRYPDAGKLSAEQIVHVLCGSASDAYWSRLTEINKDHPVPRVGALGDLAFSAKFPPCLYVRTDPNQKYMVRPGDNAFNLFKRFTGGNGTASQVKRFFGSALAHRIEALKPGDILSPARISLPTTLFIGKADAATLLATNDPTVAQPIVRAVTFPPGNGHLIVAAGYTATSSTPAEPVECGGATGSGIADPARLKAAYRWSVGRLADESLNRGPVDVWVIDNGFAGGAMGADGKPHFGPGFPARFFRNYSGGDIGPTVQASGSISPWLVQKTPSDPVMGHGTHVAGLVLGGPDMSNYLDLFDQDASSYLKLVVANVGRGSDTLVDGSAGEIRKLTEMGPFRIVNLSLEYQDDDAETVRNEFDTLFDDQDKLFVVAAGNDSDDVSQGYFPAAYGGTSRSNVITVAAHRPDGTLAAFSNTGSSVDIAAPGCGIRSWIDDQGTIAPLSGTSQATPTVVLIAAMLRTLGSPDAKRIKARIFTSGDPLTPPTPGPDASALDPARIASRSKVNPEKALYVFDDYLAYKTVDGARHVVLGTVQSLTGLACKGMGNANPKDIWAFRKAYGGQLMYTGRVTDATAAPCEAALSDGGSLHFQVSATIEATGPRSRQAPTDVTVDLQNIEDLTFRVRP